MPAGLRRLEIGPGLRPRLPIAGTYFVEISRSALARLVQHGGVVAQATAAALPFPDAAFNLVMAMDIIEHVDDEPVFRELTRVLRPGGRWSCRRRCTRRAGPASTRWSGTFAATSRNSCSRSWPATA